MMSLVKRTVLLVCLVWSSSWALEDDFAGIVLWSEGRSATTTLAMSLHTAGIPFCKLGGVQLKETFYHDMTTKAIQECTATVAGPAVLTHVKPVFLWKTEQNHPEEALNSTKDMFTAFSEAGFTTVVANIRQNQLARDLSAFELDMKTKHGTEAFYDDALRQAEAETYFCQQRIVPKYQEWRDLWQQGILDAVALGFKVHTVTFKEIVEDVCRPVVEVLALTGKRNLNAYDFECEVKLAQMGKSHVGMPLSDRVGTVATDCITEQINEGGPDFAWMLDDNVTALEPPKYTFDTVAFHAD